MSEAPAKRPPDIVLVVADDLGFGDLGCYNTDCRIPTPNVDALAARGARWTDMHTPSAVCTPSRYGMLTGRYAWRSRLPYGVLYGYEPPLIEPDRATLATLLRSAGYRTACIGKWHLGMSFRAKAGAEVDFGAPLPWKSVDTHLEQRIDIHAPILDGPRSRGFDHFFGTAGCSTAQPPFAFIEGERFVEAPTEFRDPIHFTGRPGLHAPSWDHSQADPTFASRAVSWIHDAARSEDPFFLYLAASAPHEPCLEATVPEFARGKSAAGHRGDLVWLFDWMLGEVLSALQQTGRADNTMVIVTSDNGALPGDRISAREDILGYALYDHLSCGSWRGYKAHIWEGGHRVPFLVAPAGEAAAGAATVVERPACLSDLFATLGAVCGADSLVTGVPGSAEDSEDLSAEPGFAAWGNREPTGPIPAASDRVLIHHSGLGVFSLRMGLWKYVHQSPGSGGWPPPAGSFPAEGMPGQLYDLANDPAETTNLFATRKDLVREFAAAIHAFQDGRPTVQAKEGS